MYTCDRINRIPGLQAIVPAGTMYVMVRVLRSPVQRASPIPDRSGPSVSNSRQVRIDLAAFRDIKDDAHFSELLVQEQSVFVLPGKVGALNERGRFVRSLALTLMAPADRALHISASCARAFSASCSRRPRPSSPRHTTASKRFAPPVTCKPPPSVQYKKTADMQHTAHTHRTLLPPYPRVRADVDGVARHGGELVVGVDHEAFLEDDRAVERRALVADAMRDVRREEAPLVAAAVLARDLDKRTRTSWSQRRGRQRRVAG